MQRYLAAGVLSKQLNPQTNTRSYFGDMAFMKCKTIVFWAQRVPSQLEFHYLA